MYQFSFLVLILLLFTCVIFAENLTSEAFGNPGGWNHANPHSPEVISAGKEAIKWSFKGSLLPHFKVLAADQQVSLLVLKKS